MLAVPMVAISRVWPSGSALATKSAPILPPAPARLSTTMGWPSSSPSRSAITRAVTSVAPPAWKGTIRRIGRLGQGAWAKAGAARRGAAARTARRVMLMRRRVTPRPPPPQAAAQSTFAPEIRTTSAHLAISARTKAVKASGVVPPSGVRLGGSAPSSTSRAR